MKKKTIKKRILAGLLAFSFIVPANVAEKGRFERIMISRNLE